MERVLLKSEYEKMNRDVDFDDLKIGMEVFLEDSSEAGLYEVTCTGGGSVDLKKINQELRDSFDKLTDDQYVMIEDKIETAMKYDKLDEPIYFRLEGNCCDWRLESVNSTILAYGDDDDEVEEMSLIDFYVELRRSIGINEISSKIRAYRINANVTMKELADEIEGKKQNIMRWEQGRVPRYHTLTKMMKYLEKKIKEKAV